MKNKNSIRHTHSSNRPRQAANKKTRRTSRRSGRSQSNPSLVYGSLEPRLALSATPPMVIDINPGTSSSYPSQLTDVNGTLFFATGNYYSNVPKLQKSSGNLESTQTLFTSNAESIEYLTNVNGTIYFFEANTEWISFFPDLYPTKLWKSDGTPGGTELVKDFGFQFQQRLRDVTSVNGLLMFSMGGQPWISDGTTAGTRVLKNLFLPSSNSFGGEVGGDSLSKVLVNVGNEVYFAAVGEGAGLELWKTDGTESGTVMVKDIAPGAASSTPRNLTNVNGTLYFTANDGVHGEELWKSDGTSSGTTMVADIRSGSTSTFFQSLTNVNGTLFFAASDGVHGLELWKSNGTSAGTHLVKDIRPGSGGSQPGYLTNAGGILYFRADDGAHGFELWRSDGTENGTWMVRDLQLGNQSSFPTHLTAVGDTLYFSTIQSFLGRGLWKSDGTPGGTRLVANLDLTQGDGGGLPVQPLVFGNKLYFAAQTPATGSELWVHVDYREPLLGQVDWVTQFGNQPAGDGTHPLDIGVHPSGNLVTVGYTYGALPGQTYFGRGDAFIRMLTADGDEIWTRQFGTADYDTLTSVAFGPSGEIYVTGYVQEGGAFSNDFSGILRKYDIDGNEMWTQWLGSAGSYDYFEGIAVDGAGYIYVSGGVNYGNEGDGLVQKYAPDGNLIWSTIISSDSMDYLTGIGVDSQGNVYASGNTNGEFPGQTRLATNLNWFDAMLVKLDSNGNQLWVRQFGTDSQDEAYYLAIDQNDSVYVVGYTSGTFPDLPAGRAFVQAFDGDGDPLWTQTFGDGGDGYAYRAYADQSGLVVVGGENNAAALRQYSYSGDLVSSMTLGTATGGSNGHGVAVSATGTVYLAGETRGTFQGQSRINDWTDGFIAKITLGFFATTENLADVLGSLPGQVSAVQGSATVDDINDWVAVVEALPPRTDNRVIDIVVSLQDGTYNLENEVIVPLGYRLVIDGQGGTVIFTGSSPSLVLGSGTLVVQNGVKFVNSTAASTVVINSGQFILRDSIVEESTAGAFAAIEIHGGTVDLGLASDPGGNSIILRGQGDFIRNHGTLPVSAIGNMFFINDGSGAVSVMSPFLIEDHIVHALDQTGLGLVTYVNGSVFVTVASGSIQRGVDVVADGGTVHIMGTQFPTYTVGSKLLTIAHFGGPTITQGVDEFDATLRTLTVVGTDNDDHINLSSGSGGTIHVLMTGFPNGVFSPTGSLVAYGMGGDDDIQVSGNSTLPAFLFGGEGDDRLRGGAGPSVLVGGDGDDILHGGQGRSILIGGRGSDRLFGGNAQDILIGGSTIYDNQLYALATLLEVWNSNDSLAERVANLREGVGPEGLYALRPRTEVDPGTVFDDDPTSVNFMIGAGGVDWYFAKYGDQINGFNVNQGELLDIIFSEDP